MSECQEKDVPGSVLETQECMMLKIGRDNGWQCRSDLDLTFKLAVVTLTFKILSGLRILERKLVGTMVDGVGVQRYGFIWILPLT